MAECRYLTLLLHLPSDYVKIVGNGDGCQCDMPGHTKVDNDLIYTQAAVSKMQITSKAGLPAFRLKTAEMGCIAI